MGRTPRLLFACAAAALAATATSAQQAARRNAFGDPYFQISDALPGCPQPAGPFVTEAEQRAQTHSRAERGTSCWLAGRCARPNAYAYDADIASALREALARRGPFAGTSLWVTVQRRIVFIEGCAADDGVAAELERFAQSIPDVERAVAIVAKPGERPRYKLMTP